MNIVEQLKRDEGVIPYAYQDSLALWTIGVGFLVDKSKGGGLLPEEIDFILANRLKKVEARLRSALPWFDSLDEARKGVLLNMAYNLGVDGLLTFKNTLAAMESQKYDKAAELMMVSKWSSQVGDRAKRLSKQMAKGEWV